MQMLLLLVNAFFNFTFFSVMLILLKLEVTKILIFDIIYLFLNNISYYFKCDINVSNKWYAKKLSKILD